MGSSLYQNYQKHLESIVKAYDTAGSKYSTGIEDPDAYGIVARAESAIRKICDEDSPYTKHMNSILKNRLLITTMADQIVGVVRSLKGDLEDG